MVNSSKLHLLTTDGALSRILIMERELGKRTDIEFLNIVMVQKS